jgi:antitoxin (DNA-binding transcriptional repressor) of toxin-antitoxin stability system
MMEHHVSKSDFKARALEYFREVEGSGQPLVVTDHGKPVLEVRPYRQTMRDPLDVLRGTLVRYEDPLEPVGEDEWEAAR